MLFFLRLKDGKQMNAFQTSTNLVFGKKRGRFQIHGQKGTALWWIRQQCINGEKYLGDLWTSALSASFNRQKNLVHITEVMHVFRLGGCSVETLGDSPSRQKSQFCWTPFLRRLWNMGSNSSNLVSWLQICACKVIIKIHCLFHIS